MKKVENYEYQTPTMKAFKLEKELEELSAKDPALAQAHLKEWQSNQLMQGIEALFQVGIALFVLYFVFVVL
jgi:hypothetical protein